MECRVSYPDESGKSIFAIETDFGNVKLVVFELKPFEIVL
jgi:hypothetical protein|tara:strand:- start:3161 stop:3280 length:120 start_codon:yes stop_codon:yes gene_type:complete